MFKTLHRITWVTLCCSVQCLKFSVYSGNGCCGSVFITKSVVVALSWDAWWHFSEVTAVPVSYFNVLCSWQAVLLISHTTLSGCLSACPLLLQSHPDEKSPLGWVAGQMPGTALCDSSSHTWHSPAGLAGLMLQGAALLGSYISFVPAQFLNLSEAQMPQGWTPVFVIKLLLCMNSIPYSDHIPNLQ